MQALPEERLHPTPPANAQRGVGWWLVPPLVLTLLVYFPITRNYFYTDDFLQLFFIADLHPLDYLVLANAGHTCVARNAVFLLARHLLGWHPEYFFWSVLLTHLLNVGLLGYVIWQLTNSQRLACFGAALWGTCPLQEGALGWYSVYGHVMTATAMLVFLAHVAAVHRGRARGGRIALAAWYALALVASTSFGNGVGIAMLFPLVILLLVPQWRSRWRWPPLLSLWLVVPALYVTLRRLNESFALPWVGEPVGVDAANPLALLAMLRLMAFGVTHLLLGLLPVPASASMAPAYLVLTLLVTIGSAIAWRGPVTARRQLAACVLLATVGYGLIALGRAEAILLVAPQKLGVLARYHYAPLIPVTLALCLGLQGIAPTWRIPARLKNGALGSWLTVSTAALVVAPPRINHHDWPRELTRRMLTTINAGISAGKAGENVYLRLGWLYWRLFVAFYPDNVVDGRRVYFVSPPPPAGRLTYRRTSTLFVTTEQVPRDAATTTGPAVPEHDSDESGADAPR